jgi:osmotically-inducible protein OsmY
MESTQHDIAHAASLILSSSSIRDLRQIRVDRLENKIELSGTVRSFYHKQLAQESIRTVAGGLQVINRVAVG